MITTKHKKKNENALRCSSGALATRQKRRVAPSSSAAGHAAAELPKRCLPKSRQPMGVLLQIVQIHHSPCMHNRTPSSTNHNCSPVRAPLLGCSTQLSTRRPQRIRAAVTAGVGLACGGSGGCGGARRLAPLVLTLVHASQREEAPAHVAIPAVHQHRLQGIATVRRN